MKLDLESSFDVSKLEVWLDVFDLRSRGYWLDLELNQMEVEGKSLLWFKKVRMNLDFEGERVLLLDLEVTLYFDRVSVGFSLEVFVIFLIWEASIYRRLNGFNFEFSLSIYWELITNFDFEGARALFLDLEATLYFGEVLVEFSL